MNQKAQRQEIEFPFLLNMTKSRPQVVNDFRSAERINAPYINNMIQPLWKNNYESENPIVYDYKDNRYEIKEGFLYKNDEQLFKVTDKHFEREDVTEEFQNYMAFDFSFSGTLAKLEWSTGTNSAKLSFGDKEVEKDNLFVNGVILTSRVRVFDDEAVAVIVYEENSTVKVLYMNTVDERTEIKTVTWHTSHINTTPTLENINISNPSPIINIAHPDTDIYVFSLVSNYGAVLNTREEGFYTFFDINGTFKDNLVAAAGTSTETIRNFNITNAIFAPSYVTSPTTLRIYKRNDVWYVASGTLETEVSGTDSIYFAPSVLPNVTVEYEGVSYPVYQVTSYNNKASLDITFDNVYGKTVKATVTFADGHISEETTLVDNHALIEWTGSFDWRAAQTTVSKVEIDFGGTTYEYNYPKGQYTITEETTPTTVSGAYITWPNVFLDNGNMYSFYTLNEAPLTTEGYPSPSLSNGQIIVESGSLGTISDNTYTFNIIESHVVNNMTPYTRENSIAVGQNFWASHLRLSGDTGTLMAKYRTSAPVSDTIDTSHKYTDYCNSNCTDMLYYCGTLPTSYKFYTMASANSIDVAWFHPGGYRTAVIPNSKWNLLYYVDNSGMSYIQGISYSEEENKMGTLVTPFASIADSGYIAVSENFVIYQDSHNKFYKIELKDGAKLSSVLDNKYILVNAPSYWNMWDANYSKKYHYATDYNNRVMIGYDRTSYRSNYSTLLVRNLRRYFTTAINSNYDIQVSNANNNIIPYVPITSMMPQVPYMNFINYNDKFYEYGCEAEEAREVQPIEAFFQGTDATSTTCVYLASVKVYPGGIQIYKEPSMNGISYSASKGRMFVTDILTTFINGSGNNDFAVEGFAKYPLVYNNQNKPMFLYSFISGIDVDGIQWFFTIQGQYYAVINEKLYAMIYSNGTISQSDAIIDLRDMKFVGNTPQIAFFVNPYTKQFYSFTGDAALQQLFSANKYDFIVGENNEVNFWYDESTQSIYIATEQGLIVFGPQNSYSMPDIVNVKDIEFVKGNIHIITDNKVITLRYYHDVEDFEPYSIDIETSFYGIGSNESISIDRWNIILYDEEHKAQDVELQVRSITDITTTNESKKLHIDKNAWDEWSHSALISFTPSIIKGKGLRLCIKTDASIVKIIPHIQDNGSSQPTNKKFSV